MTSKVQFARLPAVSVARYTTVVTPKGNGVADECTDCTVTVMALSDAEGRSHVTTAMS